MMGYGRPYVSGNGLNKTKARGENMMGRYLIKDVKCEVSNGGMACGPVGGSVAAAVLFEHDGEEQWLHAVEVEGMLNVFIMKDDIYDVLLKDDYDEEYVEKLEATTGHEVAGVMLSGDYCDIICELYDNEELTDSDKSFIRFVLAIVRCDWDEVRILQKNAIGRYTDDLMIPLTDVEEEYLEDNMDDDEE